MKRWCRKRSCGVSHTLMDGGTLYVPSSESGEFMKAYANQVSSSNTKLYVIELKTPIFKFFMDIDYVADSRLSPDDIIKIVKNIRISTTSRNGSVLIVNNGENKEVNINPFLVKIIAKGYYWNKLIDEGKVQTAREIAEYEKEHNVDYVKKAIRLNILSPRIVEKILVGVQPEDLTVEKLCNIKTLDWEEQVRILNFI